MRPNENYTYWATNVWLLAWECFYVCKGDWGVAQENSKSVCASALIQTCEKLQIFYV